MRKRSFFSTVFSLLILAGLILGVYSFLKDLDGPRISVSPDTGRLSPATAITIAMEDPSGIRSVAVAVHKGSSSQTIFQKTFDEILPRQEVKFSLQDIPVTEGSIDLEIKAVDAARSLFGLGNTRTLVRPARMDTQPPRLSLKTLPPTLRRGGTGVISYTVNEAVTSSGVRVGDHLFPGYPQPDGRYICFFAFPHTFTTANYVPELTATDLAGNVARHRLPVRLLTRTFRTDTLSLTDAFLLRVGQAMPDVAPETVDPLERFLTINRELRGANTRTLLTIGSRSENARLWDVPFVRLPRSAPRALYADHRIYLYRGQKVDEQDHLGYDLASLAHAEIPAANAGKVVFAEMLGIYGNIVVIDHGLGLMSLYSHMSRIDVHVGDRVAKGQTLGLTGSTGFAFGDHLHFGILVNGVEVTPQEWLDPKWIRDNVTSRLGWQ